MKRAAIYARVSTEQQAEKELSIPAQLQELKDYAADNDMEIVDVYADEGVSAKTDDRPEFQRMISEAKKEPRPFDVILFHKNDRFARNREDAIVYKSLLRRDCGIELIAIKEDFGDGPVAKMIEGILEVIAEFYSLNLAQEVKKGMKEKAKQGKALGESPLGYTIGEDGYFKIVPEEAKVVRYIFNEYTSTNKGLRSIANDLRAKGEMMFGEAGDKYKWSGNGIKVILNNKAYIGTQVWNQRDTSKNHQKRHEDDWIVVPNAHEPIVDKETFYKAQEILKSKRTQRSESRDYLLKGLVKCMDCGGNMSQFSYKWKRKDGTKKERRALRCSNYMHTGDCYFNNVYMDEIEAALYDYLEKVMNDEIALENMKIHVEETSNTRKKSVSKKNELKDIGKKFDRQVMAYEDGIINLEQLKKYKKRLQEEKEELKKEISLLQNKLTRQTIDTNALRKRIKEVIDLIRDKKAPLPDRREALKEVIKFVEYSKERDEMAVHLKK